MGRIAFYAPMKSPHHMVPSGDREIARNLMQLLTKDAFSPVLVSEFRSMEKSGDPEKQAQLIAEAELEAAALIVRGRSEAWRAWVTYHSYYKAPDLIGPIVAKALGVPYLIVEATLASKRLGGHWDIFERKAIAACEAADAIFHFTERDAVALRATLQDKKLVRLPPFLPMESLPAVSEPGGSTVLMAGMMRAGDKLASYRIAAEALAHMEHSPWTLEIAGDGHMRSEVASLMAPFGSRVHFLGQLDTQGMAAAYGRAKAFLWPGVNEAFGMVYLEAQAHGVPVVAEDRPGVNEVVDPSGLVAQGASAKIAGALSCLLTDQASHIQRSRAARVLVQGTHLLPAAKETVWRVLRPMMKERS